mgnify:CR=1 FL=1
MNVQPIVSVDNQSAEVNSRFCHTWLHLFLTENKEDGCRLVDVIRISLQKAEDPTLDRRADVQGEFVSSEIYNWIQREAGGEFNIIPRFDFNHSEITDQVQREAEEEFQGIPYLVSDSSSDEDQCHQQQEDTMSYAYPKHHDEADAEAHIRAFLTTWQANHVSQRLSEEDADK